MMDATPLLRVYAAWRARRWQEPAERVQRRVLARLLRRAAATRFGRAHGFARIGSVRAYQDAVPLRDYAAFWTGWWQPDFPRLHDVTWPGTVPFFAASSGTTTGVTKHIPVTRAMNRSNRRAALDLLCHHVLQRPASRILAGRTLMLGGSTELRRLAPGVRTGDLSGIAAATVPRWARGRTWPPPDRALDADWDAKIAALVAQAPRAEIRAVSGTVSWLLPYFERALAAGGVDRLAALFPGLEMIAHGGVAFAPYAPAFGRLLAGSRAETREVYPASEGFVAIQDRGPGEGLRLVLDHGIFFEFVPVEALGAAAPPRHWIATVETGVTYAVVLTTCAGLWSYVLGDTVRFVTRDPPRLRVTGRTAQALSAFGEHLIGEEIEAAVAAAAAAIGASLRDFSVGPVYPDGDRPGGHVFVVELARPPDAAEAARFAARLDADLQMRNLDYREHRAARLGMAPPCVVQAPAGCFEGWMRRRGRLGGQNKVPRVILDGALLADLCRTAGAPGIAARLEAGPGDTGG